MTFGKTGLRILFTLLLFIFMGYAQSTQDAIRITDNTIGFGARALGMGGAYTGVADDYSAIYWNPAGLAQIRKMEFWMELAHTRFSNDIVYQGSPSSATNNATRFHSLGLVFPIPTYRGSLVFAFGYQRLKDFEYANNFRGISSLPSDRLSFYLDTTNTVYNFGGKPVERQEYVSDEGTLNQWSFAGAMDVSPNISVGLSLNYWKGSSDYVQDFTQTDVFNNFPDALYPANFYDYLENRKILTTYSSFSAKLSGLFRAGRFARIGLGMELPQTFNVNEDYRSESSLSFDDGEILNFDPEEGTFEYDVKIPFRFFGGASFAFGPVLVSASAKYTDWTQVKFDLPSNASLSDDYSALLSQNKNFRTDYRETVKINLGGEIGLPLLDSQLRAGYIYDPSPLKNADSDNDRTFFTAGYGVLIDRVLKLDATFVQGSWKQTTYDDLAPAGTQEDITYRKILLTISYRF